jgi:hypothetical protein
MSTAIETSAKTLMDISEEFDTIAGSHDVVSFYEEKDSGQLIGLVGSLLVGPAGTYCGRRY